MSPNLQAMNRISDDGERAGGLVARAILVVTHRSCIPRAIRPGSNDPKNTITHHHPPFLAPPPQVAASTVGRFFDEDAVTCHVGSSDSSRDPRSRSEPSLGICRSALADVSSNARLQTLHMHRDHADAQGLGGACDKSPDAVRFLLPLSSFSSSLTTVLTE